MVPHPDTVGVINTLAYQERLREAANARLAASAHVRDRSPRTGLRTAWLTVISALSGSVTRVPSAKQTPAAPPLASV